MPHEFLYKFLKAITSSMPRFPGMGRVCNWMITPYLNSHKPDRIPMNVYGFELHLSPSESACQRALTFYPQLYDRDEFAFLQSVLEPGDVFADIGAHIGIYSLVASRLVGKTGKVLAVEATPNTAQQLIQHVEVNNLQNIIVRQVGVSDCREILRLNINRSNTGGNNLVELGWPGAQESVECLPLSELVIHAQLKNIKAMKLDIEGFEHRVLSHFFSHAPNKIWPQHFIVESILAKSANLDPVDVLLGHGYELVDKAGQNRMLSLKHS